MKGAFITNVPTLLLYMHPFTIGLPFYQMRDRFILVPLYELLAPFLELHLLCAGATFARSSGAPPFASGCM
jgi:hypothetical protein